MLCRADVILQNDFSNTSRLQLTTLWEYMKSAPQKLILQVQHEPNTVFSIIDTNINLGNGTQVEIISGLHTMGLGT